MRHRNVFLGTLGLIMLSLIMTGCFGLFAPKVGNISGTVMWDDETPVVDATVKVADKTTKTDKDGKFKIIGVAQGEHEMTVTATFEDETVEHKQKVTIGKDELIVSPVLQKPEVEEPIDPVDEGVISGVVEYDNGDPIADATVRAEDEDGAEVASVDTDQDGKYTLPELPYGEYKLTVTQADEVLGSKTVTLDAATLTVNFEFEAPEEPVETGVISGVVKYQSGDAVLGATVSVKDEDISVTTDGNGEYTLPELEYGDYTVIVTVDGEDVGSEDVTLSAATKTVDFTIPDPLPPEPEWRLVYEEDFSGTSNAVADYGWAGEAGWEVVEADGKRWIQGDSSTTSHTWITIPELAEADIIRLKYTNVGTRTGSGWATGILADSTTNVLGGTNYFVFRRWNGLGVRMQGMGGTDLEIGAAPVQDGIFTIELTYDRTAETIEVVRDGVEDYSFNLESAWVIDGEENVLFHLYVNNATARWTDLEVWVK